MSVSIRYSFTVYQECNNLCSCSTSRKSYDPVCGSDNVTYFSACFAGCKDLINDVSIFAVRRLSYDAIATYTVLRHCCCLLVNGFILMQ